MEKLVEEYMDLEQALEQLKATVLSKKQEIAQELLGKGWQEKPNSATKLVRIDDELFEVKCTIAETMKVDDAEDLLDWLSDSDSLTEAEKQTAKVKMSPDVTLARMNKLKKTEPDSELFDFMTYGVNPNPSIKLTFKEDK